MSESADIVGQTRRNAGASYETRTVAFDDLSVLLPDWELRLRAANMAPPTIESYLKAGDALHFLGAAGMPTAVHDVAREHLEEIPGLHAWPRVGAGDRREALPQPATALPLAGRGWGDRPQPVRADAAPGGPGAAEEELARLLATCDGQTFENPSGQWPAAPAGGHRVSAPC